MFPLLAGFLYAKPMLRYGPLALVLIETPHEAFKLR